MQIALMTVKHLLQFALARQAIQILPKMEAQSAKVKFFFTNFIFKTIPLLSFIDSCTVNNGGCDSNADCSHQTKTFAVVCTCKTGYTNVGKDGSVVCQGRVVSNEDSTTDEYVIFQRAAKSTMVVATKMQIVLMTEKHLQQYVLARQATQTLAKMVKQYAKVRRLLVLEII